MLYADGKRGTNWFNNDTYSTTAFNIQKFFLLVSMGHWVADTIFNIYMFWPQYRYNLHGVLKTKPPFFFNIIHHALVFTGIYGMLYL